MHGNGGQPAAGGSESALSREGQPGPSGPAHGASNFKSTLSKKILHPDHQRCSGHQQVHGRWKPLTAERSGLVSLELQSLYRCVAARILALPRYDLQLRTIPKALVSRMCRTCGPINPSLPRRSDPATPPSTGEASYKKAWLPLLPADPEPQEGVLDCKMARRARRPRGRFYAFEEDGGTTSSDFDEDINFDIGGDSGIVDELLGKPFTTPAPVRIV
uniref:VP2 n=1 Tax=Chicken anemia virus TaxID=12618 RepID=C4P7F8_9VIRU|nr:VP2 [Chicken anemia virus]